MDYYRYQTFVCRSCLMSIAQEWQMQTTVMTEKTEEKWKIAIVPELFPIPSVKKLRRLTILVMVVSISFQNLVQQVQNVKSLMRFGSHPAPF
jgi:hypothetical protein